MRHRMLKRISVRGHDAGLHDIWKADDIFSNPKLNESVKVLLISFLKSIIYRSWNIIPSKYLSYFCAAQKSNSLGNPKQIDQLQSSRYFWSVQVITSRGDVSFTLTHHWEWYVKNSPINNLLPIANSSCQWMSQVIAYSWPFLKHLCVFTGCSSQFFSRIILLAFCPNSNNFPSLSRIFLYLFT